MRGSTRGRGGGTRHEGLRDGDVTFLLPPARPPSGPASSATRRRLREPRASPAAPPIHTPATSASLPGAPYPGAHRPQDHPLPAAPPLTCGAPPQSHAARPGDPERQPNNGGRQDHAVAMETPAIRRPAGSKPRKARSRGECGAPARGAPDGAAASPPGSLVLACRLPSPLPGSG